MKKQTIDIYTDGSCHTQHKIGGWAAVILIDDEKIDLQGSEQNTTHNRMELYAVIRALEYVRKELDKAKTIRIFTDSQYVEQIPSRAANLQSKNFITKSGKILQNDDLIKDLISLTESMPIEFIKVKAHQKASPETNYNREVDKRSRKVVRQSVNDLLEP